MDSILKIISNLTSKPGVYQMLDKAGVVLYVGKATNLKKRVSSYFKKQGLGAKNLSLVSQIDSIEVSVTRTETEALLLEASLIKRLLPKYNILMRDDKSYPYIHVSEGHPFPRIEMIRSKKKPKRGLYFGPYPSVNAIKETLNTIQKVFKIRSCRDSYFAGRSRPCLQYQIKRCTAPCTAYISKEAYQRSIADAIKFLQGKSQQILEDLEHRMEVAVKNLVFEEAAQIRDQIKSLRLIQEQQAVMQMQGDADILALDVGFGHAAVQCVTVRDGHIIGNQSFFPDLPPVVTEDLEALREEVLEAFIRFYYVEMPQRIPALVILDAKILKSNILETMLTDLRGKPCQIQIKPRGSKGLWLDFAKSNLQLALANRQRSTQALEERYKALALLMDLDEPLEHFECFDISHTQGEATVASCVVFDKFGPSKKNYRRFNIANITPGDDYAAMEQVIKRRFLQLEKDEQKLPQIIIIDGGKGQVAAAKKALDELAIKSVLILGIAKGVHRKANLDYLVLEAKEKTLTLPPDSKALHLLQYIRDEAHRFAISLHRKKRQKSSLDSSLEAIEGIGPKRRKALMQRFGGMRELAKAPIEEISKIKGINAELALRIFLHLHPGN